MNLESGLGPTFLYACLLWATSLLAPAEGDKHVHRHDNPAEWQDVPLGDKEFIGDKDHLKEHLKDEPYIDVEDMSLRDNYILYFRSHDEDNNGRLDGLELMEAYWHSATGHNDKDRWIEELIDAGEKLETAMDKYADFVERSTDDTLEALDRDADGYIDFAEYVYNTPLKKDYWKDDNTLFGT